MFSSDFSDPPALFGRELLYRIEHRWWDTPAAVAGSMCVSFGLFVFLALAQMLGDVTRPENELDETIVRYEIPEAEVIEPEETRERDPESDALEGLEPEALNLSLDQLDIALNPGVGRGATGIAGDFTIAGLTGGRLSGANLDTEEFVDFAELDELPRPIGVSGFNFPHRLRRQKVSGRIIVFLRLSEGGEVLGLSIDSSDLPQFDAFVLSEIKRWRFTPPTKEGASSEGAGAAADPDPDPVARRSELTWPGSGSNCEPSFPSKPSEGPSSRRRPVTLQSRRTLS